MLQKNQVSQEEVLHQWTKTVTNLYRVREEKRYAVLIQAVRQIQRLKQVIHPLIKWLFYSLS